MRMLTVCSLFALLLIPLWGGGSPCLASDEGVPINWVSQAMEKQIVNKQGTLLGIVQDIVFNDDGQITYVMLSRGSAFGVIGPKIPIPWKDVIMERHGKKYVFVVDIENLDRLDDAPGIIMKKKPETFSPGFIRQVDQFFAHE